MKNTLLALASVLLAYFSQVWIPLVVLIVCMVIDYLSGIIKAYMTKTLSSAKGTRGILKKVGYLIVISVAMICDWVIGSGILGVEVSFFLASIVIVWLALNELLSILENMVDIGVPFPTFLIDLIDSLQKMTEKKGTNDDKH